MEVMRILSISGISKRLSGIIVETEAYGFSNDSVSHAFGGITRRNYVMFGEARRAYIYYGYVCKVL